VIPKWGAVIRPLTPLTFKVHDVYVTNHQGESLVYTKMSLLSQMDRQAAIEAFEFYIRHMKDIGCNQAAITHFQTLLNWIELEYYKNDKDPA
jgi:hypothetical protein